MKTVCVIGLGYVGLPLALLAADKGYDVIGLDVNAKHIATLQQGRTVMNDAEIARSLERLHSSMTFLDIPNEQITKSDFIIICVPTPVDSNHKPIMQYVIDATKSIVPFLQKGQTVVLESTVFPGTMDSIVKPILEESKLNIGTDFFVSYCPERIDPGNKKWNVSNIPRVLGSYSKEGAENTKSFYSSIIDAEITILRSPKEAEATKIMENTFRDVNIAFVNEMARSFDKMGVDILEVIKGASTKPFSFMPHFPSCGVGGHCIPVDPYYLIEDAKSRGFNHQFLSLAREINEGMPEYTIQLLEEEMKKMGKDITDYKIGVYGVAYKKNVNDIRESPSLKIIEKLREKGAKVQIYDPYYIEMNTHQDLTSFLEDIEVLVIATDHDEITTDPITSFQDLKIIIDGKNCLDKDAISDFGIVYKGIGR